VSVTDDERVAMIDQIAHTPAALRAAVRGLSDAQRLTPYRDGGWTVAQVVHHLADSHMNSYIRIRLAVTEDKPLVLAYKEGLWALLADAVDPDVEPSLRLLESLHVRWVTLLRSLPPAAFARTFRHPERGEVTLDWTVALYAWHGRHHVAHITELRSRNGW
jgi:hypothetical protein